MRRRTEAKTIALHLMPTRVRRQPRWRPWMTWTASILGGLLVLVGCLAAYYYPKAKRVIHDARQAEAVAKQISSDVSQQNFAAAHSHVRELKDVLDTATDDLHKMAGLRHWPYLNRQYTAGDQLLTVARDATGAATPLVDFVQNLLAPFSDQGKVSLATISREQKGQLLAGMANQEASLVEAQTAIHKAANDLDRISTNGLLPQLRAVIEPLKDQFPQVTKALDQAIPATHILPPILGYPEAKTYLFLFENNTELRPGGGFIGTYGLMKVSSGEITSLQTDNVYNLDENAKKLPVITPPLPMQTYLKQHAWYFRDANWSPDFPTSARQALTLYQREGGSRNVDGVLAITPTVISHLLELVGPITIGKTEFTAKNFTDKVQYYVDQGFAYAGQDESQRKDIIGILTTQLVERLMKLPVANWKDLFLVLSQELNEKQMLIYETDSTVQSMLEQQNWAGALHPVAGEDYLMVADANLASLKTDPVVYRTSSYRVTMNGDSAEATLTIHYDHRGKFDWKTTRYNTYVRVYVPQGSTLIDSTGAQVREKSTKAGKVTTSSELGLTVFGAFKSIEPGTSSDLVLRYRLPSTIAKQLQQRTYGLMVQKEAGVTNATLKLQVEAKGHTPTSIDGLDNTVSIDHDVVNYSGALDADQQITIHYGS